MNRTGDFAIALHLRLIADVDEDHIVFFNLFHGSGHRDGFNSGIGFSDQLFVTFFHECLSLSRFLTSEYVTGGMAVTTLKNGIAQTACYFDGKDDSRGMAKFQREECRGTMHRAPAKTL